LQLSSNYVVAVCTLGENLNLDKCLATLVAIKDQLAFNVEILVVVNKASFDFPLNSAVRVVFEPTRGYSSVRNAAVNSVPQNANLIFIDDDEIPTMTWLESLIEKNIKFPNDVIFGAVYPENFETHSSYRNQFANEFQNLPDEALVMQCATSNMLIPGRLIASGFVHFDPFFNLSGGEDTDLCFRLRGLGVDIRYAKKAFITEIESEERLTKEYLNSRMSKEIVNYSLVVRRNSSPLLRFWRMNTTLARILFYGASSPWSESSAKMRAAHWKSLKALLSGRVRE
jgi:succinoglycan biosynthesis protein ExoM